MKGQQQLKAEADNRKGVTTVISYRLLVSNMLGLDFEYFFLSAISVHLFG